MKSRLVISVIALAVVAAACSTGNPIASVDNESITDERVNAFHASGEAGSDFDCTLDFLIGSELLVGAARDEFGITVSGDEIDDFIASPPEARAAELAGLESEFGFSEEGVRAQVRRWVLVDEVVAELGSPSAPEVAFSEWVSGLVDTDALGEVEVDPLFGMWSVADLSTRDACASAVLARVGGVGITDADVRALNLPTAPPSEDEFNFELQFLISSELYVQEAEERFGITVTEEEISAFVAAPPAHRLTAFAQFQGTGRFSETGIRAQVRRWLVADEVVTLLVGEDQEFLQELADQTGIGLEEIARDPLAFLDPQQSSSVFNSWTTEVAEAGEFADVFVDPLVGEWDPAFRQLTPAGG